METAEEWRPIAGLGGAYDVSSMGRVRSWVRKREYIFKQSLQTTGYAQVGFYVDGKEVKRLVHRLVLEAFVGPCPDGMEACHNNGVRTDNRLSNLRWDTRQANIDDAIMHGTHFGARTHCPKMHPYTPDNTRMTAAGSRQCRICLRSASREYQARMLAKIEPSDKHCPGVGKTPIVGRWVNGFASPRGTCPCCHREYALRTGPQGDDWVVRSHYRQRAHG